MQGKGWVWLCLGAKNGLWTYTINNGETLKLTLIQKHTHTFRAHTHTQTPPHKHTHIDVPEFFCMKKIIVLANVLSKLMHRLQ